MTTVEPWKLRQRVRLLQHDIAHDVYGQGPPVVLVHGTPSWSFIWRNVVAVLARHFSVHVFDLLGYGDSAASREADISVAAQARLLSELLDYWQLEQPAAAGHDIGGAIVLRTHLIHGRQFRQIALLDAVVLTPWITSTTRHVQAHLTCYETMPGHILERIIETHLLTAFFRTPTNETLNAYLDRWKGDNGRAAYLQHVAQFDEDHTAEFEPRLNSVEVPVQIVWGQHDAWLSPTLVDRIRSALPGSQSIVVSDAGHFVMEDAPEKVASILSDFFRKT